MPSYVDTSLTKDEKVLHRGEISLASQWVYYLLAVVMLPLLFTGLLWLIPPLVNKKTTELAITNKRVIAKFGLFSRTTIEISLKKVESIQVHQSIMGRMFNYGSLVISGAGNPQAPIPGISNPLAFRTAFLNAQES